MCRQANSSCRPPTARTSTASSSRRWCSCGTSRRSEQSYFSAPLFPAPRRTLHRRRRTAAQHYIPPIAQRPFGLGDGHIELADEAVARRLIGNRQKDRVEIEQRIAREIHLRDEPLGKAGAEKREVNVVRPPGIVVIAPGIGAGLDRGEPIPTLAVGIDAALAV